MTTRRAPKRPSKKVSPGRETTSSLWKPLLLGVAGFLVLRLGIEYYKEGGRLAFFRHKVEEATQTKTLTTFQPNDYEVLGLDISHHQQQVDWKLVKNENISFAFIKATEGVQHQDRYFSKHWRSAKKHGILRGAYHFFLPARNAEEQAKNFLDRVHLEAGDLPPVLDVEVTNHQSDQEIRAGVQIWLDAVEEEYDLKPIIYTNYAFYEKHLAGHFDDYPLWLAHYTPENGHIINNHNWSFWQHTDTGRLKGIKGNADLNVFKGTMEDLYNMCYEPK
ncbi:glycoside hydrolase family 25 protein [Nibribacter ruber]|uniref:Glycoside hydrolase family 25 protein n=1 Tax=Nibribacter ruber TaxID=2698458 RepID=A0A6P1NRL3_9BACT|nr:glycoside hydrolase family 25 protein [Nibribacter ruber]QHL86466.1 glycoside hydrolase family 25 protein [Nibribacter ruber]